MLDIKEDGMDAEERDLPIYRWSAARCVQRRDHYVTLRDLASAPAEPAGRPPTAPPVGDKGHKGPPTTHRRKSARLVDAGQRRGHAAV